MTSESRVSGSCSVVSDSVTPWTIQSMEFSRPEYWSGSPFPLPGNLPNPRIKPRSPALRAIYTSCAIREAQEYWSGSPIPSPADLPNLGIQPGSPALQVDSLPTELSGKPKKSLGI